MTGRVLSVALDWTGLCVVVGQGGACAYTPVNKLRGGSWPRACRLADTCREGSQANADERRRPVSCVAMPCRQPNPAHGSSTRARREAGGLGGSCCLLSVV